MQKLPSILALLAEEAAQCFQDMELKVSESIHTAGLRLLSFERRPVRCPLRAQTFEWVPTIPGTNDTVCANDTVPLNACFPSRGLELGAW